MTRRLAIVMVTTSIVASAPPAIAGDKQAHVQAGIDGATAVNNGLPTFIDATNQEQPIPFGARRTIEGYYRGGRLAPTDYTTNVAVSDPDEWSCYTGPLAKLNEVLGMGGAEQLIANATSGVTREIWMVCNWTHFVANRFGLPGALRTYQVVKKWADRVLAALDSNLRYRGIDGTGQLYCDDASTFQTFMRRSLNSMHYTTDSAATYHTIGNTRCGPWGKLHYASDCWDWLEAFRGRIASGAVACDQAIVDPANPTQLNGTMSWIRWVCGWGKWYACAGLERVFRHHCDDAGNYGGCRGQAGYHGAPAATCNQGEAARHDWDPGFGEARLRNDDWCEGETCPHSSGNDYLTPATEQARQGIDDAMTRWGAVCKEPDDPCDDAQCQHWCERSSEAQIDVGDFDQGFRAYGYCVNNPQDPPSCPKHHCVCEVERQHVSPGGDPTCGQATGAWPYNPLPCCKDSSGNGVCDDGFYCDPHRNVCFPRGVGVWPEAYSWDINVSGFLDSEALNGLQTMTSACSECGWTWGGPIFPRIDLPGTYNYPPTVFELAVWGADKCTGVRYTMPRNNFEICAGNTFTLDFAPPGCQAPPALTIVPGDPAACTCHP